METDLRPIVRELEHAICQRVGYDRVGAKRNHVAWRLVRDGWHTMRQCSVTLYAPGCVRFRNDFNFDVPKRVWPLERVDYGICGKMEITVHESEIAQLLPTIIDIAEDAKKDYQSPLFPDGLISPPYCWSTKATQHYEAQKAAADARRFRYVSAPISNEPKNNGVP